jgi:hypothetical protein
LAAQNAKHQRRRTRGVNTLTTRAGHNSQKRIALYTLYRGDAKRLRVPSSEHRTEGGHRNAEQNLPYGLLE